MSEANRHAQSKDPLELHTIGAPKGVSIKTATLLFRRQKNMAAHVQTGRRRDTAELRSARPGQRPEPTQTLPHKQLNTVTAPESPSRERRSPSPDLEHRLK
jgi:hypothetical protein